MPDRTMSIILIGLGAMGIYLAYTGYLDSFWRGLTGGCVAAATGTGSGPTRAPMGTGGGETHARGRGTGGNSGRVIGRGIYRVTASGQLVATDAGLL